MELNHNLAHIKSGQNHTKTDTVRPGEQNPEIGNAARKLDRFSQNRIHVSNKKFLRTETFG